ncbi:MAG: hypothetical protein KGH66_00925 [Candidatus Micrarchaeota archaeon]|nr:hypothetical protein [Candidatus Micrarchaeota archaeon]
MTKLELPLITSFITIALAVLAIGLFIYFGASALFYSVVVIAIVFGFLNGWLISRHERPGRNMQPPLAGRYTRIPERQRAAKKPIKKRKK